MGCEDPCVINVQENLTRASASEVTVAGDLDYRSRQRVFNAIGVRDIVAEVNDVINGGNATQHVSGKPIVSVGIRKDGNLHGFLYSSGGGS